MTIPADATVEQRAAYLRESGVWAALSPPALEAVAAAMRPARHTTGEFIIRQGEPGSHLHVLTRGETEVRIHSPVGGVITVATMAPGACFGEMSLLSGDLTSADVVALSDCETLTLERRAFEALVAGEPPLLREFVRMVSKRLLESNVAMGAAREKEKGLTRFLQETRTEQYGELVGGTPALKALQKSIAAQAALDGPVLIQGERGTGKELVARLIHFRSTRRDAPLLSTDCAQIAETPWGDKLFGDYRPAPDGMGPPPTVSYLDLADGGTIVLKNIAALPRPIQDRLAAYLASSPGSAVARRVRIIATTRESLADAAHARNIAPALAAALEGTTLVVPALRERKRDIPTLAAYFSRKHAQRLGKDQLAIDDEALGTLVQHEYLAGNVSELEDVIRRAVILSDGPRIESEAIFLGQPPPPTPIAFNLLSLPEPVVRRALWVFPRAAQVLAAVVFSFILYQCWFVPAGPDGNWGTLLVWSVWWPVLVVSFFFAGRVWCAVCPMASAGSAAQRIVHLGRHVPAWLKRHDIMLVMAGFFLIVWAEEAVGMRRSPTATGVLLLAILTGAVLTSILLPRRSWCRYLCPLGGLAGLGSTTGLLELRPTPDICSAKCRDHSCFKGDGHSPGCPMFHHVMFVDSNEHCVLCLDCLSLCPNRSPQLNLRLPARELVTGGADPSHAGRLTVFVGGLLVALAFLQQLERSVGGALGESVHAHRMAWVTGILVAGSAAPHALLWFFGRGTVQSADPAGRIAFWRRITAWVPVVTAGFVCYELAFVPGIGPVRIALGSAVAVASGSAATIGLLGLLQFCVLVAGLIVTLAVIWGLSGVEPEAGGARWRRHAPGLAAGSTYWAVLAALLLR